MREIKFRGRRVDNGEWVDGDLITGVGPKYGKMYILPRVLNLAHLKGCDPLDGYKVDPATVGQFTGLIDKNGREVFEGDVLEADNYRVEIKFVGGQFVGYNKNYSITETQNRNWLSWVIIGDIFNNPELIA